MAEKRKKETNLEETSSEEQVEGELPVDEAGTEEAEPAPESAAEETSEAEPAAEPVAEAESEAPAEPESQTEEAEPAPEAEVEPVGETEEVAAEEVPAEEAPAEEAAAEAPKVTAPSPKKKAKRLPRSQRRRRAKPKREGSRTRKPITRLPKPEHERGRRQERRGVVVSSGMDKTIVVKVESVKAHPRYKKIIRRSSRLHAHDQQNQAKVGDLVRIVETRPLSKTKTWRLVEVVEAAR